MRKFLSKVIACAFGIFIIIACSKNDSLRSGPGSEAIFFILNSDTTAQSHYVIPPSDLTINISTKSLCPSEAVQLLVLADKEIYLDTIFYPEETVLKISELAGKETVIKSSITSFQDSIACVWLGEVEVSYSY